MHAQLPSAAGAHSPFSANCGQTSPGGQGGMNRHEPPHITPPHWGVGVARGDGWTGTQSQLPFAPAVHCPISSTGLPELLSPDSLQSRPCGHGNGGWTTQLPPHG